MTLSGTTSKQQDQTSSDMHAANGKAAVHFNPQLAEVHLLPLTACQEAAAEHQPPAALGQASHQQEGGMAAAAAADIPDKARRKVRRCTSWPRQKMMSVIHEDTSNHGSNTGAEDGEDPERLAAQMAPLTPAVATAIAATATATAGSGVVSMCMDLPGAAAVPHTTTPGASDSTTNGGSDGASRIRIKGAIKRQASAITGSELLRSANLAREAQQRLLLMEEQGVDTSWRTKGFGTVAQTVSDAVAAAARNALTGRRRSLDETRPPSAPAAAAAAGPTSTAAAAAGSYGREVPSTTAAGRNSCSGSLQQTASAIATVAVAAYLGPDGPEGSAAPQRVVKRRSSAPHLGLTLQLPAQAGAPHIGGPDCQCTQCLCSRTHRLVHQLQSRQQQGPQLAGVSRQLRPDIQQQQQQPSQGRWPAAAAAGGPPMQLPSPENQAAGLAISPGSSGQQLQLQLPQMLASQGSSTAAAGGSSTSLMMPKAPPVSAFQNAAGGGGFILQRSAAMEQQQQQQEAGQAASFLPRISMSDPLPSFGAAATATGAAAAQPGMLQLQQWPSPPLHQQQQQQQQQHFVGGRGTPPSSRSPTGPLAAAGSMNSGSSSCQGVPAQGDPLSMDLDAELDAYFAQQQQQQQQQFVAPTCRRLSEGNAATQQQQQQQRQQQLFAALAPPAAPTTARRVSEGNSLMVQQQQQHMLAGMQSHSPGSGTAAAAGSTGPGLSRANSSNISGLLQNSMGLLQLSSGGWDAADLGLQQQQQQPQQQQQQGVALQQGASCNNSHGSQLQLPVHGTALQLQQQLQKVQLAQQQLLQRHRLQLQQQQQQQQQLQPTNIGVHQQVPLLAQQQGLLPQQQQQVDKKQRLSHVAATVLAAAHSNPDKVLALLLKKSNDVTLTPQQLHKLQQVVQLKQKLLSQKAALAEAMKVAAVAPPAPAPTEFLLPAQGAYMGSAGGVVGMAGFAAAAAGNSSAAAGQAGVSNYQPLFCDTVDAELEKMLMMAAAQASVEQQQRQQQQGWAAASAAAGAGAGVGVGSSAVDGSWPGSSGMLSISNQQQLPMQQQHHSPPMVLSQQQQSLLMGFTQQKQQQHQSPPLPRAQQLQQSSPMAYTQQQQQMQMQQQQQQPQQPAVDGFIHQQTGGTNMDQLATGSAAAAMGPAGPAAGQGPEVTSYLALLNEPVPGAPAGVGSTGGNLGNSSLSPAAAATATAWHGSNGPDTAGGANLMPADGLAAAAFSAAGELDDDLMDIVDELVGADEMYQSVHRDYLIAQSRQQQVELYQQQVEQYKQMQQQRPQQQQQTQQQQQQQQADAFGLLGGFPAVGADALLAMDGEDFDPLMAAMLM